MTGRAPPKLAVWLVENWSSAYHRESLTGDLLEDFHTGRSTAWLWKQVATALLAARFRTLKSLWSIVLAKRVRALVKALMLALGVLALGVGTLTWANTTRTAPAAQTNHAMEGQ